MKLPLRRALNNSKITAKIPSSSLDMALDPAGASV